MNKVLVLGCNSFSGSSLVNFLLNKGFSVIGISRSSEKKHYLSCYRQNEYLKNFKFHKLDINKNKNKIIKILNNFKPEIVINYSAQSMVNESWDSPTDWYYTNVIGTVSLLEELKNKKYLKKYIHFSTPEVYGSTSKNIRENSFFNPSTPYAVSRLTTDHHINLLYKEFDFPSIITRASNVYGPFQDLYRIIPLTIFKILKKDKLFLHGGGRSKRSFIHINDVNNALLKIIRKGKVGHTYHISTNKKISIYDLVTKICKQMKYDFDDLTIISEDRKGKDQNYFLNSNKLRKELNWQEKISIDKGIVEVIDWLKRNIKYTKKIDTKYIHKK